MADEEEQQQYNPVYELNYLRSLLESIDNQMNSLLGGLQELRKAHNVLKEQSIESSSDTRVSIGAGIYANAKIETSGQLLVPIGSSIYIEEGKDKATERLNRNIKEVEDSLQKMSDQRTEVSNRYEALSSLVQQQSGQAEEQV